MCKDRRICLVPNHLHLIQFRKLPTNLKVTGTHTKKRRVNWCKIQMIKMPFCLANNSKKKLANNNRVPLWIWTISRLNVLNMKITVEAGQTYSRHPLMMQLPVHIKQTLLRTFQQIPPKSSRLAREHSLTYIKKFQTGLILELDTKKSRELSRNESLRAPNEIAATDFSPPTINGKQTNSDTWPQQLG